MVSQQFDSMEVAIMRTLSKAFLFRVSHMFQTIAMKIGGHSALCAGCTNLELVTISRTVLSPCKFWMLKFLRGRKYEDKEKAYGLDLHQLDTQMGMLTP
jgi:hypothetical protein